MFDVMRIKTKFVRGLLAKAISIGVYKKTGYKVKVNLEDIDIAITDDVANVRVCGGFTMNINELKKIEKLIDKEIEDL